MKKTKSFVAKNIGPQFHQRRLESLQGLKLEKVLKQKNPYLFKAKNILAAEDLVKSLVDAHLSSQEETVFGAFLEQVAIFVCAETLGGRKSGIMGVDLEFEKDNVLHLVSIKSGPKWHNKSQLDKLKDYFLKARQTLRSNSTGRAIRCINGCCYGRTYSDNGTFEKICGEEFWTLISDEPNLYIEIVEPLGHEAKNRNDEFEANYAAVRTKFTQQFIQQFCKSDYTVDWEKIVKLNSAKMLPRSKKTLAP